MIRNPSPFRVGARVQDEYGNVGTVESVPTGGGDYAVLMDATRPPGQGHRSFSSIGLYRRSELRGYAPRPALKRNPSDAYWKAPPADAHPAYKGHEATDYEWWVTHYAPESVRAEIRAERRAKEDAAYALKYPPPTAAELAQMRRDEADYGRKLRAGLRREEAAWRAPAVKAPGRKRNPTEAEDERRIAASMQRARDRAGAPAGALVEWREKRGADGRIVGGWKVVATPFRARSNPAPYNVAAIKRAARAAGHPVYSVKNGTGSLRGLVSVYFDEPLPGPEAMSRASEWLRAHYPDVPFSGLQGQGFCDYWLRYSAAERKAKDARPGWGVRGNPDPAKSHDASAKYHDDQERAARAAQTHNENNAEINDHHAAAEAHRRAAALWRNGNAGAGAASAHAENQSRRALATTQAVGQNRNALKRMLEHQAAARHHRTLDGAAHERAAAAHERAAEAYRFHGSMVDKTVADKEADKAKAASDAAYGRRNPRRNPARDAAWLRWFATLDAEGAIEALDPYRNRDPEDVLREARRILAGAQQAKKHLSR